MGPWSPPIWSRDWGPIEAVNLAVGEDVAEIFGAAVCHAHQFDANWDLVFVFKPP